MRIRGPGDHVAVHAHAPRLAPSDVDGRPHRRGDHLRVRPGDGRLARRRRHSESQYPGISQWYSGVALTLAQGRLGALQQVDWVVVGTYTPHPVVISVDGGTATVQDCGSNTTYVAHDGTTTPASPQPAAGTTPFDGTAVVGWNNVTVTMILHAGTWRLSQGVTEATPCTPASPSP